MPKRNHEKTTLSEQAERLAHWFFPVVGVVYASGFLIVLTFYKSFGINDVDFVEAKYIHIGCLFMMSCLVVILPLGWMAWIIRPLISKTMRPEMQSGRFVRYFRSSIGNFFKPTWNVNSTLHTTVPVVLSVIVMLWGFIAIVAFASPYFAQAHPKLTFCNFLFPLLIMFLAFIADLFKGGTSLSEDQQKQLLRYRCKLRWWWLLAGVLLILIYRCQSDWFEEHLGGLVLFYFAPPVCLIIRALFSIRKLSPTNEQCLTIYQWLLYTLQWLIFVALCWIFVRATRAKLLGVSLASILFGDDWFLKLFGESRKFPSGAIYFCFFMLLMFFFAYRNLYRFQQITDKAMQRFALVSTTCVLVILFYISILSFARFVYPFIPFEKGGGDYTKAYPVYLTFSTNSMLEVEFANVIPMEVQSKNTSNCLIMLDKNSSFVFLADTNDNGGPTKWRSETNKPTVYEIRREAITCIAYLNPSEKSLSAGTNSIKASKTKP